MQTSTRELAIHAAVASVIAQCGLNQNFRIEVSIVDANEVYVTGELVDGTTWSVSIFEMGGLWTYTNAVLVEDDCG